MPNYSDQTIADALASMQRRRYAWNCPPPVFPGPLARTAAPTPHPERGERLAVGDVIKGRSLWGEVTEVKDGVVYFSPISAAAGWRHASAREIIGHWRNAGRRAAGGEDDDAPAVVPREQLSLPGVHK